ncbi:MAG: DUF5615 family PIN-like protein [Candidatus Aquicultorales bacterium]
MRFLLDAGVPRSIQDFLRSQGHDALRLAEVGLLSADDKSVFAFSQSEQRLLITRERGFGDVREYPPGTHSGIIVIKDLNSSAIQIREVFEKAWQELAGLDLSGTIVVVDSAKIRVRRS